MVGDDNDLLAIALDQASSPTESLYIRPEPRSTSMRRQPVWNIEQMKAILGEQLCSQLLFMYAITGCDTTPRIFSIGKGKAIKNADKLKGPSVIFNKPDATHAEIEQAGETALKSLYRCEKYEDLNRARLQKFCEKVSSSTTYVEPQTLPPT